MIFPWPAQASGGGEGAGGRVEEFGAAQERPIIPSGDQDLAVGQQRGAVRRTRLCHDAGGGEGAGGRVEEFGTGTLDDEDLAVGQQRSAVAIMSRCHAAGGGEDAGGRVVELGAAQGTKTIPPGDRVLAVPPGDEDLAVGHQRSGVAGTSHCQAAGCGEGPGGRVVEFGAAQVIRIIPSDHEDLPVLQQRSGVAGTSRYHAAGGGEGAGGRVVEFGAAHAPPNCYLLLPRGPSRFAAA